MRRYKQMAGMVVLIWALMAALGALTASPALAQAQDAPEVEYASLPKAAQAADGAAPVPRASTRASKRLAQPRNLPAPTPAPVVIDTPATPPAVVEEPLPPWRVTVAAWLTPFGINSMLAKMGLTGPSADILGCILLMILVSVVLWLLLWAGQAVRQKILDRARQKRALEPGDKVEPAIDPANLKRNTRNAQNSRLMADSRNGPHSRPNYDTRSGPNSRMHPHSRSGPDSRMMGGNTRGGPDSRMHTETRGGPDSRMMGGNTRSGPDSRMGGHTRSLDSRMVHDSQAPDSRMYPGTRGPTGLQSQFGDTQFGNSQLGHPGQETRGHNPVVQKSEVPNAPPDFDQARFLRKARVYFLRLQLAWDKSDMASIRQFAAGPVFNEFRKQILERGETTNTTDVLAIQTELIGIEVVGGNYIASVKFTGMIKETMNPAEAPFEEVWNLSMPREKKGDWVLAGIAQYK